MGMLALLGEQLKVLSRDPANHFASQIRRLTGPREAIRFGQPLRALILALPRMIDQLLRWTDHSGLSARNKRLQRFALLYLYDPIDFLSIKSSGLFRYLDDAYLIAGIYQQTLSDLDAAGIKNRADDKALAASVPQWIGLARQLLPKEMDRIDELIAEVAMGRSARLILDRSSPKKRAPKKRAPKGIPKKGA